MEIEEIIKEMVDSNRTRSDDEIHVRGVIYKVTAYKIRNQSLIRIDIRPLEKQEEEPK